MIRFLSIFTICFIFVLAFSVNSYALLGSKELETENVDIKFAKEFQRGGYQIISIEELKK